MDVEPAQLGLTGSSSLDNKLALLGWLSKEAENTARFGSLVARDRSFWLASRRGGGRKAEVGEAGCWAGRALEPEMRMMTDFAETGGAVVRRRRRHRCITQTAAGPGSDA